MHSALLALSPGGPFTSFSVCNVEKLEKRGGDETKTTYENLQSRSIKSYVVVPRTSIIHLITYHHLQPRLTGQVTISCLRVE